MKYLIILNKFEFDINILKNKLKNKVNNFTEEQGRLVIETNDNITEELKQLQEVKKYYIINTEWKELDFKKLKTDALRTVKNYKSYIIETKFYDKMQISAKSVYKQINPYLKHEGLVVDENPEVILYVEFKKENLKRYYRICYNEKQNMEKTKPIEIEYKNLYVVLEEPRLTEEISDFLRLCWIFKMPLYIITKKQNEVENALRKAKEITKGIVYEEMIIKYIPYLSKDYIKVGFTKHATQNEKELVEFLDKNDEEKIMLVFGNDTYGLSQEVRDDLDYSFRLTPELNKPLKANQALSYVLGIFTGRKI